MGTTVKKPMSNEREVLGVPDRKSPGEIAMERIKVTLDKSPPTKPGNLGDYEKGTARG